MSPVDTLAEALDALSAIEPNELADGDTVVALHRQLARLDALVTRTAAAFDASGEWRADSAKSAAAWLAARTHRPVAACRRRVQLGRRLRCTPVTERAWVDGDIDAAHAEVLSRARTDAAADAFDRDEELLVGFARSFRFRPFQRAAGYWLQRADADGVEAGASDQRARRRLHLSQSVDGMWFLDGCLDPVAGTIVATALRRIEDELFSTDWAEAKRSHDDKVSILDVARSPAQRRADAVVEMARLAGAAPPGARRPEPLFTVLVGYETLAGRMCELANRTVVTPGTLLPWITEAWIERVVFDGPDRVINVGPRRRLFTGATRRAVEVRDRECFHFSCDEPADLGQIDHIEPFAAGGATVDHNGRVACAYHNRERHRRTNAAGT
jgi:hypothetical protein